jgi:hypothetical protein
MRIAEGGIAGDEDGFGRIEGVRRVCRYRQSRANDTTRRSGSIMLTHQLAILFCQASIPITQIARGRHSERSEESHPVVSRARHHVEQGFVVVVWAREHG